MEGRGLGKDHVLNFWGLPEREVGRETMVQRWYTLFETGIGMCGIVWKTSRGTDPISIIGLQLPEATGALAQSRIHARWNAVQASLVPRQIKEIIRRIRLHLSGKLQDFQDISLDLDTVTPLTKRVYDIARTIPFGQTRTYGQIAEEAGIPSASFGVGTSGSPNASIIFFLRA